MTYSVQDARQHLGEILEKVRSGEKVMISEEGEEVAEIRAVEPLREPNAMAETFRQLEEEGIISPASERRPSVEEILQELQEEWRINPPKPGGLARFLESRG
jgi:prevent-host-death family protein